MNGLPIMKRVVEGIAHEACMGGAARPLTDDAADKGIDYERDVNGALSRSHVYEIG